MCEPYKLVFAIPHQSNDRVDLSRVPKTATIFYHGDRWWFELETGESSNNNWHQRKKNFDWIKQNFSEIKIDPGPFDFEPVNIEIKFLEEDNQSLCSIISINGRVLETPIQRTCSPIALIGSINDNERDAVKIPDNATHYCWINGSHTVESVAIDAEANEICMLLLGGLVYLNFDQSGNYYVIQINRFQPIDTGRVQLTGAIKWQKEYTKTLLDQNRFAVCSHAAFIMEEGPSYYAFINADEELTSSVDPKRTWIPTQNGAFLYLFNKDTSPNDRDCFHELPSFILGAQVSDEN